MIKKIRHRSVCTPPKSTALGIERLPFAFFILVALFCWVGLLPECRAEEITLEWDSSGGEVAGYMIHYGDESGIYDHTIDVGAQTSCVISGLDSEATYYIAATAYDGDGNWSSYSSEIVYPEGSNATIATSGAGGGSGGGGGCFISCIAPPAMVTFIDIDTGLARILRGLIGKKPVTCGKATIIRRKINLSSAFPRIRVE